MLPSSTVVVVTSKVDVSRLMESFFLSYIISRIPSLHISAAIVDQPLPQLNPHHLISTEAFLDSIVGAQGKIHINHFTEVMTQSAYEQDGCDEAHVYFFSGEIPQGDPEGDQAELFRLIQTLSYAPEHAYLDIFLKQATHVVREEIAQLPSHLRELAPWVGNILDWTHHVVALRKTGLGGSIERVLVCVYQICLLMVSVQLPFRIL